MTEGVSFGSQKQKRKYYVGRDPGVKDVTVHGSQCHYRMKCCVLGMMGLPLLCFKSVTDQEEHHLIPDHRPPQDKFFMSVNATMYRFTFHDCNVAFFTSTSTLSTR